MINENLIHKIWNNKYRYVVFYNRIIIYNSYKIIYICDDNYFNTKKTKKFLKIKFYKNCFVSKHVSLTKIYFHEDYIHYILRQKLLNTLLND